MNLELIHGSTRQSRRVGWDRDLGGHGAMHIRGNSSVDYEKKQYARNSDEFGEDLDISPFGMPEEEDWVLHAPYSDKTLMRNHLMYKWSVQLVAMRHAHTSSKYTWKMKVVKSDKKTIVRSIYMEKVNAKTSNRIDIDNEQPY